MAVQMEFPLEKQEPVTKRKKCAEKLGTGRMIKPLSLMKRLGMFELDADIDKYNEYVLKPINDKQSLGLLTRMGIKKMFQGEEFYHATGMGYNDGLLGRRAAFNLISTIDHKIYKIYFKFLDDDRAACMAFRDEIREYLSENMTPERFSSPKITNREGARLSTWQFEWSNILLEEFDIRTATGTVWNTVIAGTSNTVKTAKRIGFFDRLFQRG